jgi:Pentapeptide repeats (9 copies)
MGSETSPAVQLAGVYAMAGLADDWPENRQICVDVLCAYLRLPYKADPGEAASIDEQLAHRAMREVRHTVIRVITAHLQGDAVLSWQGLSLDFTGVVFDGGDFGRAQFSSGLVSFSNAVFSGPVSFSNAAFSGATVNFSGATFCGGKIDFGATFSGGIVDFEDAVFSGGEIDFHSAIFSGSKVLFFHAAFSGAQVSFTGLLSSSAKFIGGIVDFGFVSDWTHPPKFSWNDLPLPDPERYTPIPSSPDCVILPPAAWESAAPDNPPWP